MNADQERYAATVARVVATMGREDRIKWLFLFAEELENEAAARRPADFDAHGAPEAWDYIALPDFDDQ